MHLALIGYGKMGRAIEAAAVAKGHEICAVSGRQCEPLCVNNISSADVCLEFTHPSTVVDNLRQLLTLGKPLVIGTTGWDAHREEVQRWVDKSGVGVVFGPNFALGVHVLYRLTHFAGRMMQRLPQFSVGIVEEHHQYKADSPSGTALALRDQLPSQERSAPIASLRCGSIPGTHQVIWDAPDETVTLTHVVRSRAALAAGAVVAAEWIRHRRGFFTVDEMVDDLLKQASVAFV